MNPERKGHMMAWYYRWADMGTTDLVTVYVAENDEMTDLEMREKVENKLRELGGENIRLYMMKRWKQFPMWILMRSGKGFMNGLIRCREEIKSIMLEKL